MCLQMHARILAMAWVFDGNFVWTKKNTTTLGCDFPLLVCGIHINMQH